MWEGNRVYARHEHFSQSVVGCCDAPLGGSSITICIQTRMKKEVENWEPTQCIIHKQIYNYAVSSIRDLHF